MTSWEDVKSLQQEAISRWGKFVMYIFLFVVVMLVMPENTPLYWVTCVVGIGLSLMFFIWWQIAEFRHFRASNRMLKEVVDKIKTDL